MLEPPPSGRSRTLSNGIITAFLALQLLVPLRYYLGNSQTDERFSWRMFSSVRMEQCTVSLHASTAAGGDKAVPLSSIVQSTWIDIFREFHQPALVESFLEWSCARTGARQMRFERHCETPNGSPGDGWSRSLICEEE